MVKTDLFRIRLFLAGFMVVFNLNTTAFAGSAVWDSAPINGDWNTAGNWTPDTVPNGAADAASFATSLQTAITVRTLNVEVIGLTSIRAQAHLPLRLLLQM